MERKTTVLVDTVRFPECPRWHEGKLWFSDFFARRVMSVDLIRGASVILTAGICKPSVARFGDCNPIDLRISRQVLVTSSFLSPGVNTMGLAAIAFGNQDGFEQCYREFAPGSPVEFQGEREKMPCLELVKRFERGWRE